MNIWISVTDAAELEGISERAIQKRIAAQKYAKQDIREVEGQGGASGKQYELRLSVLPVALQETYFLNRARQADLPLPDVEQADLRSIAPWRVEEAKRRLRLVLNLRGLLKTHKKGEAIEMVCATEKRRDPESSANRTTLADWHERYGDGGVNGFLALLPKERKHPRKQLALDSAMTACIEQYYLSQARRSVTLTHRRLCEHCAERGIAAPSEQVVRRYILRTWPESVRHYFRQGAGSWRKLFEPIVHRDYAGIQPNDLWCGDQRIMDTLLRIPTRTKTTYRRPWLSLWLDVKSATVTGWHLSFEADVYMIALALRRGIIQYGLPKQVYMDNGKQYRALYLQGNAFQEAEPITLDLGADAKTFCQAYSIIHDWNAEEKGILDELEIGVRHSLPVSSLNPGGATSGVSRSKPVEPFFNNFHEFEMELPGWCGNNPKNMPEKLKREIKADELLTLEEYVKLLGAFIQEINGRRHGWRPMASSAYYNNLTVTRARERDLDLLLRPKKMKMVKHAEVDMSGATRGFGIDLMPGLWYTHEDLAVYSGQYVVCWYDPLDLSSVVVTTAGKHPEFICEITKQELSSWKPTAADYKNIMKRRKTARKSVEGMRESRDVLESSVEENLLRESGQRLSAIESAELPSSEGLGVGKGKGAVIKMFPDSGIATDLAAARQEAVAALPTPAPSQEGKRGTRTLPSSEGLGVGEDTQERPSSGGMGDRTALNRERGAAKLIELAKPAEKRKPSRDDLLKLLAGQAGQTGQDEEREEELTPEQITQIAQASADKARRRREQENE